MNHRPRRFSALTTLALLTCLTGPAVSVTRGQNKSAAAVPNWVWLPGPATDGQVAYFRKPFTVDGEVKSAVLWGTCDNEMKVYVNGQEVAASIEWRAPVKVDVAKHLKAGPNVLAVRAKNEGSEAGLLLRLDITGADGAKQTLTTDKTWVGSGDERPDWQAVNFDAGQWQAIRVVGKLGDGPWGDMSNATTNGEATAADTLVLPPGFEAQRLYSVPKGTEGSWVSMTPDPKGRLYVSAQEGPLYRVTVGADESATVVEKVDLPIGAAQGLLWAFDSLYVVVNGNYGGNGSGLYRLQDTNNDDKLDKLTPLKKIDGGGEHGPHAVRLGPDGKTLFVIAGNHTKTPEGLTPTSPHKNFAEDHLLPRNPDGNGHATGVMAPGGWICKTDENGSTWELWCGGFRNQYDIAFNEDGELFSFDADMEYDTGAPWYRPTRVNLATSGAEFGWRYGTGKWPAYYPDSLGAVVNIGMGSPTGIEFGTGAKFPAKYQRALFINDWSYGKVYAVHMTPEGAGYTGSFEPFVEGKPFNVTDVVINPADGAMYITIGGRGTQSGLYRVTYTGKESTAAAGPEKNAEAEEARALRHKLESFHGKPDPAALAFVWPHLNSPDRHLRYAARVAVEWQPVAQWQSEALSEQRPTAAINALVALARSGDKALQPKLIEALNKLPLESLSEEQLLEAMRAYGLAFIRMGKPDSSTAEAAVRRLDPLFPSASPTLNRELVQVLVYLQSPTVVQKAMDLLAAAGTQEDQFHYVFVLRNKAPGWTPELRKAYFSWLKLAQTSYHGGASFPRFLAQIVQDALAGMTPEEREAVEPILNAPAPATTVVKNTKPRQFVRNWQMADLLPVVAESTKGRNFDRGRETFAAAQCFACHRFAGEGGSTGPDLTGVGNRFSPQDTLESIVHPSKVISDQYASTEVITKDRNLYAGFIEQEDAQKLVVRTNPLNPNSKVTVPKDKVAKRRLSKLSPMPQGLIDILNQDEILDLIAYVRSGGNKNDKAFAQ